MPVICIIALAQEYTSVVAIVLSVLLVYFDMCVYVYLSYDSGCNTLKESLIILLSALIVT